MIYLIRHAEKSLEQTLYNVFWLPRAGVGTQLGVQNLFWTRRPN
jgi:hypothetical protein